MQDAVMGLLVFALFAGITALLAVRETQRVRSLLWLALVEYTICCAAQLFYSRVVVAAGGDMALYADMAKLLQRFLDGNFSWAARELFSMLIQQPSAFDNIVFGGGESNTASMYAACAFLLYFCGGSVVALHGAVSGLAFLGALGIFYGCRDAAPKMPAQRLFGAIVMFPSVAFWTCALHKESFCLLGLGAVFVGWRAVHQRRVIKAALFLPLGVALISFFRTPALPPVALGIAIFIAMDRLTRTRGADAVVVGPFYLALGLGVLALAMVVVSRVSPALGLDRIGETMATKQEGWATSVAGSAIDDDGTPRTLAGQLARIPYGLLNALFRPQFFDVHNIPSALGAMEMTALVVLVTRAIRATGLRAFVARIQRSPFLAMCLVITIVGCTFVGLATFNLGSLARYRVPFLPFYGAFVISLATRAEEMEGESDPAPAAPGPIDARRARPRRHRSQPIRVPIGARRRPMG